MVSFCFLTPQNAAPDFHFQGKNTQTFVKVLHIQILAYPKIPSNMRTKKEDSGCLPLLDCRQTYGVRWVVSWGQNDQSYCSQLKQTSIQYNVHRNNSKVTTKNVEQNRLYYYILSSLEKLRQTNSYMLSSRKRCMSSLS